MDARPMGVLVAVDGSTCAAQALAWAVADAAARGTRLTVATVAELPRLADVPVTAPLLEAVTREGRDLADGAVAEARTAAPGTPVEGLVATGNPAAELLRMATGAEEVVVGSRGDGGFAALLLGSVGGQVAAYADRPVVVVRGEAAADGPVVVGIDGSDHSEKALEYGFAYAERHGLPLLALHVCVPDTLAYPMMPTAYVLPREQARIRADAARATASVVDRWSEKHPAVPARWAVEDGQATQQLVAASGEAALLVVGSHGHGRLVGMVLGSVGQAAVRHAHCPVAVVR